MLSDKKNNSFKDKVGCKQGVHLTVLLALDFDKKAKFFGVKKTK